MIGETLSHYLVLEELGAGGMGVVYKARDRRIGRDVALKVLPRGVLAGEAERARFHHEALALSRLSHPGIATLFEYDRAGGSDFLVMELVGGETLEKRLAAGPLEEREAVCIGREVADALHAAHEQGIVHRDLKPQNVVLTPRGHAKVLDFGIARLVKGDSAGTTSRDAATDTAVAVGTPAYMAPELLLGRAADPRSDVYALGVVLFRMTTGALPFDDADPMSLVGRVLGSPAPAPRALRPGLSPTLERVILRCLEKDPSRRHASAAELAEELGRLERSIGSAEARGPGARITSLAVLPLANISGDPAQEYFADGMTEALIADLAQVGALRVISRTSAMQYKGARQPLPEIARALNVDAVVEGSVLRAGDRVRITAQLIDAASDQHLWARSYERDAGDVLALQGEVARAIVEEIRVQLTPREEARLAAPRPVDPRAFEAHLRGRFHWNKRTPEDVRRAIDYFQQAIEADPAYAPAYAGLADAYNILGDLTAMPAGEAATRVRAAATRALEIDQQLAEAHTSLGFLATFYEWDWARAENEYRLALALNPNYATGHQWYAEYLASRGRFDEGIARARRAIELDPFAIIMRTSLADVLFFARRYQEAIETLRQTLEMEPRFVPTHTDLGRVLTEVGRHEEAIAEFREAVRLTGSNPNAAPGLGYACARGGRVGEAREVLANLLAKKEQSYVSCHAIVVLHLGLGDREGALRWLERAYEEHDRALVWMGVHPRLDPLRGEPRFQALLGKVGLG